MDLYNEMYERREKLADQMKDLQEKLIRLPTEDLHVQKDRGNTRWALSGEDEKGKHFRRYLSKTQEEEAVTYAVATLYRAKLSDMEREYKATSRFLQVFDKAYRGIPEVYITQEEKLLKNEGLLELLMPYLSENQKAIIEWEKESYEGNTNYHPEQLIYRVSDTLFVRSKSELMIAEELIRLGIPFRYEERIGKGWGSILCDFTILDPKTLYVKYYEHFGMMDKEEYAKAAVQKISNYASRGIYPGQELIITSETQKHPLTKNEICRTLRCYLHLD